MDSTAPESAFGQRAVIDGLAESEHQLRIIPTDGAIAIDAVVVEGYFETTSSLD